MMRTALTIAGSDPSGGAGLQADLKAFQRFGVYGMAAPTLLTVQNTLGVRRVEFLPPDLVYEEIAAIAQDLPIHAAKTGALGSALIIAKVAEAVARFGIAPLVVDPVMVAKSGDPLLDPSAVSALVEALFPLATLITPNRMEAEALLGRPIRGLEEAEEAALALLDLGPKAALLKGGHLEGKKRWTSSPQRRGFGASPPPGCGPETPTAPGAPSPPLSPPSWPWGGPWRRPWPRPRPTSPGPS